MGVLLVSIGYIGGAALLGVLVRRWWLLGAVLVLWVVAVAVGLARDDVSYQNTRAAFVGMNAIGVLLPAELGAALGIVLGRRLTAR